MSAPASSVVFGAVPRAVPPAMTPSDVEALLDRYGYPRETRTIIESEGLLPPGLLSRLHRTYPGHSGLMERAPFLFPARHEYEGLRGFRKVVGILEEHGIRLGAMVERELFVEVYRFKATSHALNTINWGAYETTRCTTSCSRSRE